jgi:hypothetical protein
MTDINDPTPTDGYGNWIQGTLPIAAPIGATGPIGNAGVAGVTGTGITISNGYISWNNGSWTIGGSGAAGGGVTVINSTGWTNGTIYTFPTGQLDLPLPEEKKKDSSDGCSCKKCKEFYPMAVSNQPDGSMVCYGCRMVWI